MLKWVNKRLDEGCLRLAPCVWPITGPRSHRVALNGQRGASKIAYPASRGDAVRWNSSDKV